jgi:phospholipid/cholesterol/gamma-HCH transport system ATP-binding protein
MVDPLIRVENFTAASGDVVIDDIFVRRGCGQVFVIPGQLRLRKSTLLKHMIGLYPPARGRILIEGRDLATAGAEERLAILKRIGVMYQMGALFGSMTLLDNVRLPLEEFTNLPEDATEAIGRMKLQLVALEGFRPLPSEISGGMKKQRRSPGRWRGGPRILFWTSRRRASTRHRRSSRPADPETRPQPGDHVRRRDPGFRASSPTG